MDRWRGYWYDRHWPDAHWYGQHWPWVPVPTAAFILGMQARIYLDTVLAALVEVPNIRVGVLSLRATEVDNTPRNNHGWRATSTTSRDCTVTFEMFWASGGTGFDAIRSAFDSGDPITLTVLDQEASIPGAQGPRGDFIIVSFFRNEANDEAITVSVTARLAQFDKWVMI